MLARFTQADWPNMKKGQRESLHRKLHRVAYPNTYSKPVSVADMAKMLGLVTIR